MSYKYCIQYLNLFYGILPRTWDAFIVSQQEKLEFHYDKKKIPFNFSTLSLDKILKMSVEA